MKVFISWSGEVSRRVAMALHTWLPSMLQSVDPYVSTEDIAMGARWNVEVGRALEGTSYGILCVTRENLDSRWLNFEAGALSKSMDASRVSPFLIDLRPADLVGPLSQFQATMPRIEDMLRLAKSINSACERPIDETRLAEAVDMWWPRLEEEVRAAITEGAKPAVGSQRDSKDMIQELLEIARGIQRRLISDERDDEVGDIDEWSAPGGDTSLTRLEYRYSRPSRREEAHRQIRDILNVYLIRNAVIGNIGRTAITLVFKEVPREEVASTIKAITEYHGFELYTFVADSVDRAKNDAIGAQPETEIDDQNDS